ncbi:hypothetical protein LQZ24_00730 [Fructobacillus sp. M1-13]|uniref:DUF1310 family protein n=1 Tax=Fructobacillus papyriferae TaxID=2713171 RepID=A0ABS5QN89_9LACO|nr:hypothetical protein [Fructobacillus papyriferae]MBS9334563.1 hypothetical protein [Fructobacillus papyriferae]MCD2158552.1 hypothetical protein [Fructobacillus papyriferae]
MIAKIKKLFRKNWLLLLIMIAVVMAITFYRGGVYMKAKAEEQRVENLKAEKVSARKAKNTFENIKAIHIQSSTLDRMTGYINMGMEIVFQDNFSVTFGYSYSDNDEFDVLTTYTLEDPNRQKRGVTASNLQVTYSNGEKETI